MPRYFTDGVPRHSNIDYLKQNLEGVQSQIAFPFICFLHAPNLLIPLISFPLIVCDVIQKKNSQILGRLHYL